MLFCNAVSMLFGDASGIWYPVVRCLFWCLFTLHAHTEYRWPLNMARCAQCYQYYKAQITNGNTYAERVSERETHTERETERERQRETEREREKWGWLISWYKLISCGFVAYKLIIFDYLFQHNCLSGKTSRLIKRFLHNVPKIMITSP